MPLGNPWLFWAGRASNARHMLSTIMDAEGGKSHGTDGADQLGGLCSGVGHSDRGRGFRRRVRRISGGSSPFKPLTSLTKPRWTWRSRAV